MDHRIIPIQHTVDNQISQTWKGENPLHNHRTSHTQSHHLHEIGQQSRYGLWQRMVKHDKRIHIGERMKYMPIMIAHRLKTVRRANQILVLEHGRITQRGTHEQLMQEPGIYADFIRARQKAVNWKIS